MGPHLAPAHRHFERDRGHRVGDDRLWRAAVRHLSQGRRLRRSCSVSARESRPRAQTRSAIASRGKSPGLVFVQAELNALNNSVWAHDDGQAARAHADGQAGRYRGPRHGAVLALHAATSQGDACGAAARAERARQPAAPARDAQRELLHLHGAMRDLRGRGAGRPRDRLDVPA